MYKRQSYDYGLIIDEPYTKKLKAEYPCWCGHANCRGTLLSPKDREDTPKIPSQKKSKAKSDKKAKDKDKAKDKTKAPTQDKVKAKAKTKVAAKKKDKAASKSAEKSKAKGSKA